MKYSDDDSKRFWSKVDIRDEGDCWNWMASMRNGYGQFYMDYAQHRSHRVAWELINGEIPYGMLCLHRCDNPLCCNSDHLYLGTQIDNMKDKVDRNRLSKVLSENQIKGNARSAKLHDYEIKEIRQLAKDKKKKTWISKKFDIGCRTVYEVLKPLHICKEGYYV